MIKEIKNTVPWIYVIKDLNGEKIIGTFYEKNLQKTNQRKFRIEKVIKKTGNKLYVEWKGYDNSFNSWISRVNTFPNHMNLFVKTLMSKLIYLFMQQKLI